MLSGVAVVLVWFGVFHSQDHKDMRKLLLDACATEARPAVCRCLGERTMSRISWLDASITGGTLGLVDLISSKARPSAVDLQECGREPATQE